MEQNKNSSPSTSRISTLRTMLKRMASIRKPSVPDGSKSVGQNQIAKNPQKPFPFGKVSLASATQNKSLDDETPSTSTSADSSEMEFEDNTKILSNERLFQMWKKQSEPKGILNFKFECFAISSLQALIACDSFVLRILTFDKGFDKNNEKIVANIASFLRNYIFQTGFLKVTNVVLSMGFSSAIQDDAFMFVSKMGEIVDNGTLMKITNHHMITCSCRAHSKHYDEEATHISLFPLLSRKNALNQLLNFAFFNAEQDGDLNHQCSCKSVRKHFLLNDPLPKILSFYFVQYDKYGQIVGKDVQFPRELDMNPFVLNKNKTGTNYTLKSVIYHNGCNINSGHYIAKVFRKNTSFICNDHRITKKSRHSSEFWPCLAFYERSDI